MPQLDLGGRAVRQRQTSSVLAWFVVLWAAPLLGAEQVAEKPVPKAPDAPPKPRLAVTLSKATTRIIEPLRPDGYPDYAAALDRIASYGITPENNAVVLLLRTTGLAAPNANARAELLKGLAMGPLPERGAYFVDFYDYVKRRAPDALEDRQVGDRVLRPPADEQFDLALQRPWSNPQCALVADWLLDQEKFLPAFVEVSKRARFYVPQLRVDNPDSAFDVLRTYLAPIQSTRAAARTLKVRAMHRLAQADPNGAWDDLQACHRCSRLVAQGPSFSEGLTAVSIEGIACDGEWRLAHESRLTRDEARRFRTDLGKLTPLPRVTRLMEVTERFVFLERACSLASGSASADDLGEGGNAEREPLRKALGQAARAGLVDWDEVLRAGNAWFDRMVEACQRRQAVERQTAVAVCERDLRDRPANIRDVITEALKSPRDRASRLRVSQEMAAAIVSEVAPGLKNVLRCDETAAIRLKLTEVSLALSAYRTEHGQYPDELRALAPDYLERLPEDPYDGGGFRYRRRDGGYVLYSVGPNGRDDGGPPRDGRDGDEDDEDGGSLRDSDDEGFRLK